MEEAVVRTERKLNTPHAGALAAALEEGASKGGKRLIVDMADTTYISSVCLRELLKMHKKMKAEGGELMIRNARESVMEVFDVTGFSGFLNFEEQD